MKKIISIIITCVVLCGCNFDPYYSKRPFDYGDAVWICEEPNAWFQIDYSRDEYYNPEGMIHIDGEDIPIKLFFVHETNQVLFQLNKEGYSGKDFNGECEFSQDKMTVKIYKDTAFDGKYKELVFERREVEITAE